MSGILLPAGCCCKKGSTSSCENCDLTPIGLTVVFSGITLCTNCIEHSAGSDKYTSNPAVPNGSFTLTQDAPGRPCTYLYNEAASGELTQYEDDVCEGNVHATFDIDRLFIQATIGPSTIKLGALWRTDGSLLSGGIFTDDSAHDGSDCFSFSSMTNTKTDCESTSDTANYPGGFQADKRFLGCEDGSATITPIWG